MTVSASGGSSDSEHHDDEEFESDTDSEADDGDDGALEGLLPTFYTMQKRRVRRIKYGVYQRSGLGGSTLGLLQLTSTFLIVLHLCQFDIGAELRSTFRYVPRVVTVLMVGLLVAKTYERPVFVFAMWVKAELFLCAFWALWQYDFECVTLKCLFHYNKGIRVTVAAHGVAVCLTLLLGLQWNYVLPFLLRRAINTRRGARCWWCLRRSGDPGSFTYSPHGWFSMAVGLRVECGYKGGRDEEGRPHGRGVWCDDSHNGECLQGHWEGGELVGIASSQETGPGSQFIQLPVCYATSSSDCRAGALRATSFYPGRAGAGLRYGCGQLEVSIAGGFFPFLPSVVVDWVEPRGIGAMLARYKGLRASCSGWGSSSSRRRILRLDVVAGGGTHMPRAGPGQGVRHVRIPVRFEGHAAGGHVHLEDLGEARALVERPDEALVLIHGCGTSLGFVMGKLAQLYAIGGMAPHIVPFVFYYGTGSIALFCVTKAHMPVYFEDFAGFLRDLRTEYSVVHILCHSCGAEFFFSGWPQMRGCFAKRCALGGGGRGLQLASLTMINPDVLVEKVHAVLPDVMDFAERFTSYNDCSDRVLWISEMAQSVIPRSWQGTGRMENTRTLVFGRQVTALALHPITGSTGYTLKGRMISEAESPSWDIPRRRARGMRVRLDNEENLDVARYGQRIDIIDCTYMEQNVDEFRHNYFVLNTQVVGDLCELISRQVPAGQRTRLMQRRANSNIYTFLAPPPFVNA